MIEEITNIQDYFLIPRIIESILFLLIASRLYHKFPNQNLAQRPLLHRLFFVGILGWTIYAICDIFIFSFAAYSFDPSIFIYAESYSLQYPSLFIANILRDLAIMGQLTQVWAFFFVSYAIIDGESKTTQKLRNHWAQFLILLTYCLIVVSDLISVQITDTYIIINANWNGISGFFLAFNIIFYFIAALRIRTALTNAKNDQNSREFSKRITLLSWGIMMMGFSFIWALFWNIFAIYFFSVFLFFFASYFLHIFWMSSPVLIYLGLKGDNI